MLAKACSLFALPARQWAALSFVITQVLPVILRTGRRPVVFSRWSGMGDIICTIPAALELKKRHPGATFLYNCHPDFAVVPTMAGVADRCIHCACIGVAAYRYPFLFAGFYHFAHGDDTPGQTSRESMVAEFCRQFDLPAHEDHPRIAIERGNLNRARARLKEMGLDPDALIIIHPGPSWPVKEWPLERWAELVSGLGRHGFANIAQIGVGHYSNFGNVAVDIIPGAISLVDKLSLEETFAVISLAKLHIGIDSGPLHIAAAVGTPSVGLFGMTSPHILFSKRHIQQFIVSRVECQGCYHRLPRIDWVTGCPHDIRCMKTLPVDEVLDACLGVLGSAPSSFPWPRSQIPKQVCDQHPSD